MYKLIQNNKHCLWLLYYVFYLPVFFLIEKYVEVKYIIDFAPDRLIPFCEWFIFPYISWYITMPLSLIVLMLRDKEAYLKLCFMMFTGMTIALIIYVILPNGIDLRTPIEKTNIAAQLCTVLRTIDTPTNVCPSIHVSSAVASDLAIRHSNMFKNNVPVKAASFIVCVLICISTVFIQQHSIVDVIAGWALTGVLYIAAYFTPLEAIFKK